MKLTQKLKVKKLFTFNAHSHTVLIFLFVLSEYQRVFASRMSSNFGIFGFKDLEQTTLKNKYNYKSFHEQDISFHLRKWWQIGCKKNENEKKIFVRFQIPPHCFNFYRKKSFCHVRNKQKLIFLVSQKIVEVSKNAFNSPGGRASCGLSICCPSICGIIGWACRIMCGSRYCPCIPCIPCI